MATPWWTALTAIGPVPQADEVERRRLYLLQYCNLLAAGTMLALAGLYGIAGLSSLKAPIGASLGCIPFYGLSWFLNRRGQGEAAKVVFLVVMVGSIFSATWFLLGKAPGMHFYFLLAAVVPLFFWPLDRPFWAVVFMASSLAGFLAVQGRVDETAILVHDFPPGWLGFFNGVAVVATYVTAVAILAALQRRSEADARLREALLKQFEELSNTDPLTGLHNRRSILRRIEEEQIRMNRNHTHFAVLLGDIDHFKALNDGYGHEAGDAVLTQIGALLRGALRDIDSVARWGGEEFLIVLPDTSAEGALVVGRKLCSLVAETSFPWASHHLRCTMTFGTAVHGVPSVDLQETIRQADVALYRGKDRGRNQVVAG